MSRLVKSHQPCPDQIKCQSSDACSVYTDHSYCFSCGQTFGRTVEVELQEETGSYTYEYLERRGITKETHEFFGVKTKIDSEGVPVSVGYIFPNGAVQVRKLAEKEFRSIGPMKDAAGWGTDKFPAGSAKSITITEGNDDAMSAWQMLGKYPVYAVKSASSALKDVKADFDYLNSFERVYLCLDDDVPGRKAAESIAHVFGFNKVYHVKNAPYKDATDFLKAGKAADFRNVWHNAGRFLPDGILSSRHQIHEALQAATAEPGTSWPFPTLTYMTGGIKRARSVLISGLTGIGKTEVFHATEYHLAKTDPTANIGIIHLEEPVHENVQRFVGYELQTPCHTEESTVDDATVEETLFKVAGREDRIHFLKHFGSDEPAVLLSKIRFLVAACECKYVFLDNITIISTGRAVPDVTKELDYLSTALEMMVKELNFALIFISHENENENTRGSANINKVCDVWINLKRDVKNENEYARRILYVTIFKNRQNWRTGPAGRLLYDPDTSTLSEITDELPT